MEYFKKIEITCSGLIIAEVFDSDGKRKGLKFYGAGIFDVLYCSHKRLEKLCKKARQWADEHIQICKNQEV